MAECPTCPHHVEVAKDIVALKEKYKGLEKLLKVQMKNVEKAKLMAKQEMERRLKGMNGLEARANARIVDAENRAKETTQKAEKKLEDQAKEFIKTVEFKAENKVQEGKITVVATELGARISALDIKLNTIAQALSEKKGEKKWTDIILHILVAALLSSLVTAFFLLRGKG
jgi:hypothetical protein